MALEASDLNDGTILQQTKQNTDARGSVQFEIILPSGRKLTSEFIARDNAKKALYSWIETVKEQAVADSNAERLERAAKARRAAVGKMDIERKPGDDQPLFRAGGARVEDQKPNVESIEIVDSPRPDENALTPQQEKTAQALTRVLEHARQLDAPAEVDPLAFAKAQRDLYSRKVEELKKAERKLWQWTTIVETLEENEE